MLKERILIFSTKKYIEIFMALWLYRKAGGGGE